MLFENARSITPADCSSRRCGPSAICSCRRRRLRHAFVRGRDLTKQEGILFKHLLRMILLCGEFAQVTPKGVEPDVWQARLTAIADGLTTSCRAVDPQSTDELLEEVLEGA